VKPAGIILAAGRSSRMGRPKALLPLGVKTFLAACSDGFLEVFDPVVVVLGHDADDIEERAGLDERARIVRNPAYDRGMLSSLQCGIAALPAETEAAAFTLVDHPAVRPATLRALADHFRDSGADVVLPRFNSKRGHPVLARRSVLDELAALPAETSPKRLLRARRTEKSFLDVDDPGVVADIDTPEDYERLLDSEES
jgi:molybdenum cofactor cytidylyltransferase